ncbi:MAG: hypothetical protein ACTSXG_00160 [Alphaproteobacteria bacterium]
MRIYILIISFIVAFCIYATDSSLNFSKYTHFVQFDDQKNKPFDFIKNIIETKGLKGDEALVVLDFDGTTIAPDYYCSKNCPKDRFDTKCIGINFRCSIGKLIQYLNKNNIPWVILTARDSLRRINKIIPQIEEVMGEKIKEHIILRDKLPKDIKRVKKNRYLITDKANPQNNVQVFTGKNNKVVSAKITTDDWGPQKGDGIYFLLKAFDIKPKYVFFLDDWRGNITNVLESHKNGRLSEISDVNIVIGFYPIEGSAEAKAVAMSTFMLKKEALKLAQITCKETNKIDEAQKELDEALERYKNIDAIEEQELQNAIAQYGDEINIVK